MNISDIKIGTLLEIYIRRDGYNYKVISKIEYVDDERIGVTPIASRTRLFRFKDSDVVDIVYRLDNTSWRWERVRAGIATLKDGTKLHVFVPSKKAEVYNRRMTYRLVLNTPITLTYEVISFKSLPEDKSYLRTPELTLDATLNEISERYKECTCEAVLKDISEGGAAICTDTQLNKGDIASFELPFGEETVKCRLLVIRSMPNTAGSPKYSYGLSFIETSSNFVQYFFTKQRQMLSESKFE